jgi:CRISPR/Cas system-associated exonuclease Cas4 (RecB family)
VIIMPLKQGNTRVVISMTEELRKELEKEAEEVDRSLSNYIVQILKQRKSLDYNSFKK